MFEPCAANTVTSGLYTTHRVQEILRGIGTTSAIVSRDSGKAERPVLTFDEDKDNNEAPALSPSTTGAHAIRGKVDVSRE